MNSQPSALEMPTQSDSTCHWIHLAPTNGLSLPNSDESDSFDLQTTFPKESSQSLSLANSAQDRVPIFRLQHQPSCTEPLAITQEENYFQSHQDMHVHADLQMSLFTQRELQNYGQSCADTHQRQLNYLCDTNGIVAGPDTALAHNSLQRSSMNSRHAWAGCSKFREGRDVDPGLLSQMELGLYSDCPGYSSLFRNNCMQQQVVNAESHRSQSQSKTAQSSGHAVGEIIGARPCFLSETNLFQLNCNRADAVDDSSADHNLNEPAKRPGKAYSKSINSSFPSLDTRSPLTQTTDLRDSDPNASQSPTKSNTPGISPVANEDSPAANDMGCSASDVFCWHYNGAGCSESRVSSLSPSPVGMLPEDTATNSGPSDRNAGTRSLLSLSPTSYQCNASGGTNKVIANPGYGPSTSSANQAVSNAGCWSWNDEETEGHRAIATAREEADSKLRASIEKKIVRARRNRESADRSRKRKKAYNIALEMQVSLLSQENMQLRDASAAMQHMLAQYGIVCNLPLAVQPLRKPVR